MLLLLLEGFLLTVHACEQLHMLFGDCGCLLVMVCTQERKEKRMHQAVRTASGTLLQTLCVELRVHCLISDRQQRNVICLVAVLMLSLKVFR